MSIFTRKYVAGRDRVMLTYKQLIAMGLVALIAALGVLFFVVASAPALRVDKSKYQVIYLANGQAYFGKLQNTRGEFLVVRTPYTMQSVQPTPLNADEAQATTQDTSTTLVKVSGQVYGPEESIALRAEQVIFWQNLRDDSKVSQALKAKE